MEDSKRNRKKLVPLYDRLVLQPLNQERTAGGIHLTTEVQQKMLKKARVLIVGPGKLNADTNEFLVGQVKPGDVVFINSFLGMRIRPDRDTEYVVELGNGQTLILEPNTEYIVQKEDELICREMDLV